MYNINMSEYLKSFIIGPSYPVFILFFKQILLLNDEIRNCTYEKYTIVAPLFLGAVNVLSFYIGNKLGMSLEKRLLYTSILAAILVMIYASIKKSYNMTNQQWRRYYAQVMMTYLVTFNVIIYAIEKNIKV